MHKIEGIFIFLTNNYKCCNFSFHINTKFTDTVLDNFKNLVVMSTFYGIAHMQLKTCSFLTIPGLL